MSGDMADFALDEVMDEEEAYLDYLTGNMSDLEAFDRGMLDCFGGDLRTQRPARRRAPKEQPDEAE